MVSGSYKFDSGAQYSNISLEKDDEENDHPNELRPFRCLRPHFWKTNTETWRIGSTLFLALVVLATTAVFIIAAAAFFALLGGPSSKHSRTRTSTAVSMHPEEMPHCGTSVAESRTHGCVYDPMMNAWTPPACYFHHIVTDFLAANETWYYDEDHQHVIPLSELLLGELEHFYPQEDHHLRHCLYTWRKLSWAYSTGSLLDADSASYKHGGHCAGWLTPGAMQHRTPVSTLGFMRCVPVGAAEQ